MKASPATLVLGFLLWVWVVLPYFGVAGRPGGSDAVRRVLAAKFYNQTS